MAEKKIEKTLKKKTLSLKKYFFICYKFKATPRYNKEDIPQDLKEEWNKIAKKNNLSFEDFDLKQLKTM